ncbi:MAG: hypothetical protein AAGB31_11320 [Bdellovibrio sp.]
MKEKIANFAKIFGAFVLPASFQGRVEVKTNPISNNPIIEIKDIRQDDNISALIKSIEAQIGHSLQVKEVSPGQMVLSTQDNVPVK